MAPKLTRMAHRIIMRFAENDRSDLSKVLKSSFARVAEATMPSGRRWSGHKSARAG
jgi:hypothetical protein